MKALVIAITEEQLTRLEALCECSGLSPDAQIGGLIDLSRSTRFMRFAAAEAAELAAALRAAGYRVVVR